MEEETISMTMEEDDKQFNQIEINDNKTYNNYVLRESDEKEERVEEIERMEENIKEKEEKKKEIQIKVKVKDQTINKLTKDIMALKKKHENEISTKHECDKKYSNYMLNLKRKIFDVNNLTQQLLFLKDKLSKLENKNTQEEKKKDEVTYNITDSSETQIVNDLSPNVVVADEISSSEDDLPKKKVNS
ncbi:hypothetical protein, conserved [Entamoeba histolytica]